MEGPHDPFRSAPLSKEAEAKASSEPGPHRPVRRSYTPITGKDRDVDAFDRVARFRILGWSLVGAFLGVLLGVLLFVQGSSPWVILLTALVGWAVSYFGPLLLLRGAGGGGSVLYAPSGRTTPR